MTPIAPLLRQRRLRDLVRAWSVARRFAVDVAPYKRRIAVIAALALCSVAIELLRPWPIQWIFDNALGKRATHAHELSFVLWTGIGAALAIAVSRAVFDYLGAMLTNRVGQDVARGLRHRVFSHLTQLSPAFHASEKSGDLLMRLMGDVPMVRNMLIDSTVTLVTRTLIIVGTLGVMFWMDWLLTCGMLLLTPPLVVLTAMTSRKLTEVARRQRKKEGHLADAIQESIQAIPLIQSLGRAQHVVERFAKTNRAQARAELKSAAISARLSATLELLFGVATAVALALGSWRVVSGHLTPGELLAFLSYVRGLLKPARSTSKQSDRVSRAVACGERVLTILDTPIAITSKPGAPDACAVPSRLAFEDVTFRYGENAAALHSLSAEFERGKLVGVFGRSGSGKSTLTALALRLYDPDEGRVTLDGCDVRDVDLVSLRERFGLCMQDAVLFGDSIRENLLLGRPDASDEALWAACTAAAADGFIAALPSGLDTQLGAGGAGLSGGERRRLCLARTLLRDAPILIVDEPFSGLDLLAVERVRATLSDLARERIVIVIAHDLDHLDAFDEIWFMAEGRIVDRGPHAELLERSPLYRRITRAAPSVMS